MSTTERASTSVPQTREPVLEILIELMEKRRLPDVAIRFGIRRLCAQRLHEYAQLSPAVLQEREQAYLETLICSPVAVHTKDANEQHYELPPAFFDLVLGENKKYSCAFFAKGTTTLDEAERAALEISMDRAQIRDGMHILELGCGWGSLTLAMAIRFPSSTIVALSNSASQRAYIEAKAVNRGLKNVRVVTRDFTSTEDLANEFGLFDRIVSIEMFEHMRNYEIVFARVAAWLKPDGKLFTHIFTHREHSYFFDTEGTNNWMGKYFFTGGQMPSRYLFRSFQKDLRLEKQWTWDGTHYEKTSNAWLANLDRRASEVLSIMKSTYGEAEAAVWLQRWRVFFMSCAELFGYQSGTEWFVSHYLFGKHGE